MPKKRLNVRALDALKSTPGKQVDYFDESLPGFFLRVSPMGTKSFGVMYRHGGRVRRMSLGTYPPLSLADARGMAKEAMREAAKGGDPAMSKKLARMAESFSDLADQYLERYAKPRKKSWREDQRIINNKLVPVLGNIKAKSITRSDIRLLLDSIADGAPIEANRTLAVVRRIYNWAISKDILEHNPCHKLPAPGKEHQRDRVLSEEEIKSIWMACDEEQPLMATTFKLRLATAQRASEIFGMEWKEINLDAGWWTIPAEKAKNGLTHRVPLNRPALRVLERLKPTADSSWVFPSPLQGQPMDPRSAQKAIQRIRKRTGIADFCGHDMRRTAASFMTGMGISRLTVSKILNHVESGITAVYDRHSYDKEKREALNQWGRRLQMIISGLKEVAGEMDE